MSVFFNGRLLVSPTVETTILDTGMATAYPARANNVVALIGISEGGIPKEPMFFDSPVIAQRQLRAGPLLDAARAAFNPSAETGSPARVCAIRIEEAVRSQIVLKDAASADVLRLQSADYGAHTNGISVTVESGTTSGKRITLQSQDLYFSKDNVEQTLFTVRYSGAETTATVSTTAEILVLTEGANPAVNLQLSSYRSVRELCDVINSQPGFSAVAINPSSAVSGVLDARVATNCKTADVGIKADLQAIIDWCNTAARDLVYATRVSGAASVPNNSTVAYLSGGANGPAPTNQDWQDGFDVLQQADVQWVVPLSAAQDVWNMARAHVHFMSGPGKSERRALVGGDVVSGTLSDAIDAAKAQAIALNSDRTSLCFPPMLEYNEAGELEAVPAYYLAAKVAGGFAAMNFGNTMTNKVLSVAGTDPVLTNVYDSDSLINGGVLGVRRTQRGFVVSKAVTTWLSNQNYNRVEVSTGVALDYVARSVREALEVFIGRKASPITIHEAISATDSVLRDLARPEPVGPGVIVGDGVNPAYRGITAEINGDILRVWFECSPVIPINFVLVSVHAKSYSGSASSVVTGG